MKDQKEIINDHLDIARNLRNRISSISKDGWNFVDKLYSVYNIENNKRTWDNWEAYSQAEELFQESLVKINNAFADMRKAIYRLERYPRTVRSSD